MQGRSNAVDKATLLGKGKRRAAAFCVANGWELPPIQEHQSSSWRFDACAYYRYNYIAICPAKCAAIGLAGRSWSYPGYVVDRTPFGVIQHELGHFVDFHSSGARKRGAYFGEFSSSLRQEVKEAPITSYCPNDAEWFAEIFRLYVTNPDLLLRIRPKAARELFKRFKPVVTEPWDTVLEGAPERVFAAARKKFAKIGSGSA